MKYDLFICDLEIQLIKTLWLRLAPLESGKIKSKSYHK